MARSTATAVVSQGPINRSGGMFVFEGPYARQYSTHWTIGRMFQALFIVAMMFVGFLAYGEFRYRFSPSAYWNVSPVEHILREVQAFSR